MNDITLQVTFTQDQYLRFKSAMKQLQGLSSDPTDEELIAQMKREASAITYAVEVGNNINTIWTF